MVGYEDPTFFIRSGDVGFADRQKTIFDKLTVAEKERNDRQEEAAPQNFNSIVSDNKLTVSRKRTRSEMKQFRGKESIFKRPEAPPPRFKEKGVPDYHRNPHKWVKYSLADVSQEDMSDRSNTAAAFSFLKEMEERKNAEKMDVDEISSHVTFKQPKNKSRLLSHHDPSVNIISDLVHSENSNDEEKPSFRSSKLIMPEYIVGVTKKKDKRKHDKQLPHNLPKNETMTSNVKLGHLIEEDDGE